MTLSLTRRAALAAVAAAASVTLAAPLPAKAQATGDIVDTAVAAGSFSTLVAAVQAAGLVETLKGPGPLTVFAPTDEAFAALPAGTVESLLLPENRDRLVSILTYHVAPDSYPAEALLGQRGRIPTAQGGRLRIDGTDGVSVDGATVTAPDVFATNGVIHVIDAVLMPDH
ncbi:fasciclin domain-containing protein [Jannaschia sp. Os4]|uniref:fasciclin domain-containing protein n=1 Tax=Jannaschia sp. Os4 TaxID=2807617 RepID=UPI001939B566|nr:fasciclin domain-containing protein [Jannaschia sp. Os4]MBM2575075.1 fasciclin domain-containing protein [Jannaschia sp. Os4]